MRSSIDGWLDAARDTGHLVAFRARTVRRRRASAFGVAVVLALTAAFAIAPSGFDVRSVGAPAVEQALTSVQGNLGAAFAGFLLLAVSSAMGSGGGRELLSRSEAAVHPVGPVTEHLGALLLAPVNLAWLVQLWGLLAVTALVAPAGGLLGAQVVVLAWVLAATALGQAVGWAVEGVRRSPHGVVVVRVVGGAVLAALAGLHLAGVLGPLVRSLPTTWLAETAQTPRWPLAVVVLLVLAAAAVVVGARPAAWALGLPPREELRVQSGVHEARHAPEPRWTSPERALLRRLDRDSVWRSVGMRRGLLVLGLGPGLVALVAGLEWGSVMVLPGLTASGAALLFGVNAWCLDGRGMVWRETLPVAAGDVFDVRALVVAECMALVSGVTVVLALLRNGLPPLVVGVAVLSCWLVVVVQVLAIVMTWSVRSPYAVDLSSPRATPAPHAAMAGYAGRLSLVTTLTALLFTGLAVVPWAWVPAVAALPFLAWSGRRLVRARRCWLAADERARVVLTVAAV
ncbi:hypothetical protein GCM10011376_03430 [Nocardioides flavus (ex Wang et al. 2016)]|uniref:ABC-2 type transport system permease protein n=1 Tax=Nocardioides flavus (ex Wang et al. 2016) TaxID=2058780 RepID=A0ABQ3HDT7_9ACTN|nr:hypothetical protein [Nocardioides flavus (ex Wang et al. 2016)]GHE15410.1 hypothetical protein GCM10011376_03430 [Nocardioides flavus (ex Wang et al. 2016)]